MLSTTLSSSVEGIRSLSDNTVMSEHLAKVFKLQGVSTYHKPFHTVTSVLVCPKDRKPPGVKN